MQRREFISGVGAAAILSGNYQANAQASDANSKQPQPAASSSAAAASRFILGSRSRPDPACPEPRG
jgi:hypothetical protein